MKNKYFFKFILGFILLVSCPTNYAQNILFDGDFSITTEINRFEVVPPSNVWSNWLGRNQYDQQLYNANVVVEGEVCKYEIFETTVYAFEIQLVQAGFQLIQGHAYQLSFDVKADENRTFGVFLGENEGNWTNLIGYDRYEQNASTDWQTIVLDFNAYATFPFHKLSFELGSQTSAINTYFDNVMLKDLGPYTPEIGIIGNSVMGWDEDVDLLTDDGIIYHLENYPLNPGQLRFRQDNSWDINWGNRNFPSGIAYLYGPDVRVTNKSNYDISFNRETGEYSFQCVANCSPYIGILGSAVPPHYNWDNDINMRTYDGENYILPNRHFENGSAKFRQDDSWDIFWGATIFPAGTAELNGEEIPITEGNYNVSFNITTGAYSFTYPVISLIGSALNGWDEDIIMQTTDGINYLLEDYPFFEGEVKFRSNENWEVNWGSYDFPQGWGYQNGPNIPVQAGTYNVNFNLNTKEYIFTATSCPVAGIQCPDIIFVGTEPGMCGATVYYPEVIAFVNCGGNDISIEQIEGLPSESFFPVGATTNTFVLTNLAGDTATCSFDVVVYDSEPPIITIENDAIELWPANHKMINVPLNYEVYDNCGTINTEIFVYSNEEMNGLGDGNHEPDWEVVDDQNVLLRAERSGKGTGRMYYVVILINDGWNYTYQVVVVTVPHDAKNKKITEFNNESQYKGTKINSNEDVLFKINAWPNPSADEFTISINTLSSEPIDVSVSTISGMMVSKFRVNVGGTLNFGKEYLPGLYIVYITQGDNNENFKIVKK